ncbi:MAG: tail fiber domain-containing protein [Pseudomonadota bacterium]
MTYRYGLLAAVVFTLLAPQASYAQCVSPTASEGAIDYDATLETVEVCTSTAWTPLLTTAGLLWQSGAGDAIYYDTGAYAVGIGTSTPASELQVIGDIQVSNFVKFDGVAGNPPVYNIPSMVLDDLTNVSVTSPATNEVLTWNGTNWVASVPGAGSSLWTDNGTHITRENFHIIDTGSNSTAAGLDSTGSIQSLYDPNKGAFRGGGNTVIPSSWSDTNISDYSFAWGDSMQVSGEGSVGFGQNSVISGMYSGSIGTSSNVEGDQSFSVGINSVTVGDNSYSFGGGLLNDGNFSFVKGNNIENYGDHNSIFGSSKSSPPAVVNSSDTFTIFLGDQANSTVDDSNVLALVGGQLLIDAVDGGADTEYGCIRYNDTANQLEWSNNCESGTPTYTAFGGGGSSVWTDNTTHISYETINLVDTGQTTDSAGLNTFAGSGLIYDQDKSALIMGTGLGFPDLDDANIGIDSFILGADNTNAGGDAPTIIVGIGNIITNAPNAVFGDSNIVTEDLNGIFGGAHNIASIGNLVAGEQHVLPADGFAGFNIVAGDDHTVTSNSSAVFGYDNDMTGNNSFLFGQLTTIGDGSYESIDLFSGSAGEGHRSAAFGLGDGGGALTANESFAIFFGSQTGSTVTDENVLALKGGQLLIDAVDGGTDTEYGCIRYNDTANQLEWSNNCESGTPTYTAFGGGGGGAINDLSDAATDYVTDFNMFMGQGAGASIASGGAGNIGVGQNALTALTTGIENSAFGYNSLTAITAQNANTAFGYQALQNSTSSSNTGFGANALQNATSGRNTAVSGGSLRNLVTGGLNTFVGFQSGLDANNINNTVAVGDRALPLITSGDNNVAIGRQAGQALTSGQNNTFLGTNAGDTLTSGDNNILIGNNIQSSTTTSSNELNIGDIIRGSLTNNNLALGTNAAVSGAGAYAIGPNSSASGAQSVAIGSSSTASGDGGFAIGNSDAAGGNSFSMGIQSTANGYRSFVFGRRVDTGNGTAQSGGAGTDVGNYSFGFGLGNSSGTYPRVVANESAGFFFGDQDSSEVTEENVLALVGGQLLIDGVDGGTDTEYGCIRYNDTANQLEFSNDCEATTPTYTAVSGAAAINDLSDGATDYVTDFNMFMGQNAGANNPAGASRNLAIGQDAFDDPGKTIAAINNFAIGLESMSSTTTGYNNTAVGRHTLRDNLDGHSNVAVGDEALENNTSGANNTAVGRNAMFFNTTGVRNTGVGIGAAFRNETGSFNVGLGGSALSNNIAGDANVGVGWEAGRDLTGSSNIAIGRGALYQSGASSGNVAVGTFAMEQLTGPNNVAVGHHIARNATSGQSNVFIGSNVGGTFTDGNVNILIGSGADVPTASISNYMNIGDVIIADLLNDEVFLDAPDAPAPDGDLTNGQLTFWLDDASDEIELKARDASGDIINVTVGGGGGGGALNDLSDAATDYTTDFNMFLGDNAGANTPAGAQNNIAIGQNAFNNAGKTNAADNNTAIGRNTLSSITTGYNSIAIGNDAGSSLTTNYGNIAIGPAALSTSTGDRENIALGLSSLRFLNGGSDNVSLGSFSQQNLQIGSANVSLGNLSLLNNESGQRNVTIGYRSGQGVLASSNISQNVLIGMDTGINFLTGADNNIMIGYRAGDLTTTGANNVLIGHEVDASSATASNELNIGNTIYGNLSNDAVAIGTTASATGSNSFAVGDGTSATNLGAVALGRGTTASGSDSVALGAFSEASGIFSFAAAGDTVASGGHSVSLGRQNFAAGYNSFIFGNQTVVGDILNPQSSDTGASDLGNYSVSFGLGLPGGGATSRVVSNSTFGVFFGDHANSSVANENSFALKGGKLLIDDVDGGTDTEYGCIRYDDTANRLEFSNNCESGTPTYTSLSGVTAINDLSDAITDYANRNMFLGEDGGTSITTGERNTTLGDGAGGAITEGQRNTIIGDAAGAVMTTAVNNTLVGQLAGNATTGDNNTFIGQDSGGANTTGFQNTFLGSKAGRDHTTGSVNTFIGNDAGRAFITGTSNTFVGEGSGINSTGGDGNTFVGRLSGNLSTGDLNVFLGNRAGETTTTGSRNIIIGNAAQTSSATASDELNIGNTIFGNLVNNQIGINTNDFTDATAKLAVVGDNFTGFLIANHNNSANNEPEMRFRRSRGTEASPTAVSDDDNIGEINFNVFNGTQYERAGVIAAVVTDTNATGSGNHPAASFNFMTRGPTQTGTNLVTDSIMYLEHTREVGINNTSPNVELDVNGDIEYTGTITDVSDRRLKENIETINSTVMLDRLMKIQGRSFQMIDRKNDDDMEYGVIAQEIEEIFPELVRTDDSEDQFKSVNYTGLIAPIVEGMKELYSQLQGVINNVQNNSEKIAALESENETLRAQVETLKSQQAEILNRLDAVEAAK